MAWSVNYVAMFCLNDTMRYFLCPGKTDMRKGINSLCGLFMIKWDMTFDLAMCLSLSTEAEQP